MVKRLSDEKRLDSKRTRWWEDYIIREIYS